MSLGNLFLLANDIAASYMAHLFDTFMAISNPPKVGPPSFHVNRTRMSEGLDEGWNVMRGTQKNP